jgi:hypothetical protein
VPADRLAAGCAAVAAALLAAIPASAAAAAYPPIQTVTFRTVPATAGVLVRSAGTTYATDAAGLVTLNVRRTGPRIRDIEAPRVLPTRLPSGRVVRFDGAFDSGRALGLAVYARTRLRYVNLQGTRVPARRVEVMRIRSADGLRIAVRGARTPLLRANRVGFGPHGVRSRPLSYAIDGVMVDGGDVVNRAQQRFVPLRSPRIRVPLLLYSVRFVARDALFGGVAGSALRLRYPSGRTVRLALHRGVASAAGLPRGQYSVRVEAAGYSFSRPIWLSRDQIVPLQVISPLDVSVVFGGLAALALGLVLVGRPALRRTLRGALSPRRTARATGRR